VCYFISDSNIKVMGWKMSVCVGCLFYRSSSFKLFKGAHIVTLLYVSGYVLFKYFLWCNENLILLFGGGRRKNEPKMTAFRCRIVNYLNKDFFLELWQIIIVAVVKTKKWEILYFRKFLINFGIQEISFPIIVGI